MNKAQWVLKTLQSNGFILCAERPVKGGLQLIFQNGSMVTVYRRTGTVLPQGKHIPLARHLLGLPPLKQTAATTIHQTIVFVKNTYVSQLLPTSRR